MRPSGIDKSWMQICLYFNGRPLLFDEPAGAQQTPGKFKPWHDATGVEGLKRGLARFMNRHVSREHATLEVYLSHGLAVTSVLGPVARAAAASPRLTAHAAEHEQHDRCVHPAQEPFHVFIKLLGDP